MAMSEGQKIDQELAGRLVPGGHELRQRIYFEDTDFSGLVYHARYLQFMERARSDFLRLLGVSHRELEAVGLFFAVHKISIEYRAPARIDDIVTVRSLSDYVGGARIRLNQSVMKGAELLTDASVSVVLLNSDAKPARIPASVRAKFSVSAKQSAQESA